MNSIHSHVGVKNELFNKKEKKKRKEAEPLEMEQPGEQCPGGMTDPGLGPSFKVVGKQS